jgi:hypothetical protein
MILVGLFLGSEKFHDIRRNRPRAPGPAPFRPERFDVGERRCGRTFAPRPLDRLAPFCGNELPLKNSVRSMAGAPPQEFARPAGTVAGGPIHGAARGGRIPCSDRGVPWSGEKVPCSGGAGNWTATHRSYWRNRRGKAPKWRKFAKFAAKFPAIREFENFELSERIERFAPSRAPVSLIAFRRSDVFLTAAARHTGSRHPPSSPPPAVPARPGRP